MPGRYLAQFVKSECDSLSIVEHLDKDILKDFVGIRNPAHLVTIMAHIQSLKQERHELRGFLKSNAVSGIRCLSTLDGEGIATMTDLNMAVSTKSEALVRVLNLKDYTSIINGYDEKQEMQHNQTQVIKNPLVCVIGVSQYTSGIWAAMPGAKQYVQKLVRMFTQQYQFKHVYSPNYGDAYDTSQASCSYERGRLTQVQLHKFIRRMTQKLRQDTQKKRFDALLVCISSRGSKGGVMITNLDDDTLAAMAVKGVSHEKEQYYEYKLQSIFGAFKAVCVDKASLLKCPRVYIIDACRGPMGAPTMLSQRVQHVRGGTMAFGSANENELQVYGNPDDYAVLDLNEGGTLMNAFVDVMTQNVTHMSCAMSLHEIVLGVKLKVIGKGGMQCVQTVD